MLAWTARGRSSVVRDAKSARQKRAAVSVKMQDYASGPRRELKSNVVAN